VRILFVVPYVPSSVRIRPYAFIRELTRLGHQVTLVCLVQPQWEETYLDEIKPHCQKVYPVYLNPVEPFWHSLVSIPTRVPLSVSYCRSDKFERLVKGLCMQHNFDLIHTEFVRAAPVTAHINNLPKVYDAVDSMTLAYRRSISAPMMPIGRRIVHYFEWLKMRKYEPWVLGHFDKVIASSFADRKALESASISVELVPNGVDANHFSFYEGSRDSATILFLGKMSYYVNVISVFWFYHNVWPLIRKQHPGVIFKIVGRNPIPKIRSLSEDSSIEVTGTVPDVRPYLNKATISICPIVSGAGIQNKVLEAMATGTPCVVTSLACQALEVSNCQEVLIADTVEEFASSVLELLDHPEKRRKISEKAHHYVKKFHDWKRIGLSLNRIYDELS
jgi:glycosyltransferase involved in cell wall biosynthesis